MRCSVLPTLDYMCECLLWGQIQLSVTFQTLRGCGSGGFPPAAVNVFIAGLLGFPGTLVQVNYNFQRWISRLRER